MKKYLVFFLCIFCLVGCTNKSSKEAVIEYLEKYRNFGEIFKWPMLFIQVTTIKEI